MIKVHPFILHGHRLLTLGDGLMSEENFYFVCRHVNPCFTVLTLSDCPTAQQSKPRAKAKPNLAGLLHVTKSALLTGRISARFLWARPRPGGTEGVVCYTTQASA